MTMNVAIDGPAGAGKSSIAKRIAEIRHFIYVDTGAMYRALAVYFLRNGLAADDEEGIAKSLQDVSLRITYENGEQQILLNEENVTPFLRTEEVGNMASASSVYPCVRAALLDLQRNLAATNDVIMDGRDIGTNILPNAQVKIYLTASVDERAKRRFLQLEKQGTPGDLEQIKQDITERDYRDMNRKEAPLRQAEDAVYIDSSDMTIEEVVACICKIIDSRYEA